MMRAIFFDPKKNPQMRKKMRPLRMTEVGRLNVKVLASGAGDASLRQALEAIVIRKEDPPLNKKQEWTSEPRKRKIKSENQ